MWGQIVRKFSKGSKHQSWPLPLIPLPRTRGALSTSDTRLLDPDPVVPCVWWRGLEQDLGASGVSRRASRDPHAGFGTWCADRDRSPSKKRAREGSRVPSPCHCLTRSPVLRWSGSHPWLRLAEQKCCNYGIKGHNCSECDRSADASCVGMLPTTRRRASSRCVRLALSSIVSCCSGSGIFAWSSPTSAGPLPRSAPVKLAHVGHLRYLIFNTPVVIGPHLCHYDTNFSKVLGSPELSILDTKALGLPPLPPLHPSSV